MKIRTATATAIVVLAAGFPAAAGAGTLHFSGPAVGVKPDSNMRISFDVRTGQGRPKSISNVTVTGLDYRCHNGDVERDLRLFDDGSFKRSGKFEITETQLPPGYANDFYGKFAYPKKGKRAKPTITGWITSEFGFGPTRDTYNCLGAEQFKATPKG